MGAVGTGHGRAEGNLGFSLSIRSTAYEKMLKSIRQ